MEHLIGQIKNSLEVEIYGLDLNYPIWDSQGRSESNILQRTQENKNYILQYIDICNILEPYTLIDDSIIEEYMEINIKTMPPIILTKYENKYEIIDGNHRYNVIKEKNIKQILAYIPIKL